MMTKNCPLSPNGLDDISKNPTTNTTIHELITTRLSRRDILKTSALLSMGALVGGGFSGCGSNDSVPAISSPLALNFTPVAKSTADILSIPEGYSATVLYKLGDPLTGDYANYKNDGTEDGDSFNYRAGDHHDGMEYFGLNASGLGKDPTNSKRGLLCINHENITQPFLHPTGTTIATTNRPREQIDKEVNAHGVSIVEVVYNGSTFGVKKGSSYNRRITASTICDISGPVKGNTLMKTKFSPDGTQTRGTLNNCANGYTPWRTYLTCEENWAGYFKRTSTNFSSKELASQSRYGVSSSTGSYGWANSATSDDLYDRWHVSHDGNTEGTLDYRNVANTFGWVVEIDPYTPHAAPKKRTAMGRCGHEGAMCGKVENGKPLTYYMGDDARNEYIYKYVSNKNWDEADGYCGCLEVGDKYLDDGKLYVAKFNADGSGEWIELNITNTTIANYGAYTFSDQADVLTNVRHAADAVGATPMDRPEWTGVHPTTGDIYITLTNNSQRGKAAYDGSGFGQSETFGLDAANPRYYKDTYGAVVDKNKGNVNGHIMRLKESNTSSFSWDIYLFGAEADASSNVNISSLTDDNDFSSPDGLWFSQTTKGLMWLQTDDGAYTDETNCMMLAAIPGSYGDGGGVSITNTAVPSNAGADQNVATFKGKSASSATLKRFLVGPKGCEITGITETPDGKAIFVNIQHPGENTTDISNPSGYESHWPDGGTARPRSATIVITKNDGGKIGL